ncbi:MAG: DUF3187 family protein [Longimicrobiales bacterium]
MSPRPAAFPALLAALALATVPGPLRTAAAQTTGGKGGGVTESARSPEAPPGASFGPLTTEEAAPLQRLSLTPTSEGADLVGDGRFQAQLWIGYANIFEQDSAATHELFLDTERLTTATGVRWGATERVELGARVSFETTGGGILDGFVSGWHTQLGLGNGNREKYPFGVYEQTLRDGAGRVRLDVPRRTMDLEDVRLFAKWQAWKRADSGRLVSVQGTVRFPAQDDPAGERRADLGLRVLGRASWTRWHVHGAVGGATARAARNHDGMLRGGSFFADLAVERTLAPWVSGVAQLAVASPRLRGFAESELDGWPVNLVFGAAGRLGDGWRWDVSFQEDIPPNTPAVDFTLGVGLTKRW